MTTSLHSTTPDPADADLERLRAVAAALTGVIAVLFDLHLPVAERLAVIRGRIADALTLIDGEPTDRHRPDDDRRRHAFASGLAHARRHLADPKLGPDAAWSSTRWLIEGLERDEAHAVIDGVLAALADEAPGGDR